MAEVALEIGSGNSKEPAYMYLDDAEALRQGDPQLHEAFELLRRHSPLGRRFLEAAEKNKVRFLRVTFNEATRGLQSGSLIEYDARNSVTENAGSIILHELMHWNQPDIKVGYEWDGRSRLLSTLACESGAQTCAIRCCYEMHLNGYSEAFNRMANSSMENTFAVYSSLYSVFDRTYRGAVAKGKPDKDALLDAGDATYNAYFREPDLVSTYGLSVLEEYIENIVYYGDKSHPIPSFGLINAKAQARINNDENLIHNARLPLKDSVLFRNNILLRQALDYIETCHILKRVGHETNLSVQRRIVEMREDKNPFFNVPIETAYNDYCKQEEGPDKKSILKIMMQLAGKPWPEDPQKSFDFSMPPTDGLMTLGF